MTKLFRNFVLLLTGLLSVSMLVSCGGDENPVAAKPVPVNFVSATPAGGEIAPNGTITVTFDNTPNDVTVSAGTIKVSGKTAAITGPFTSGPLALTITWADGTEILNYTVIVPCCGTPIVLGGSVNDGDTDVNPEIINSEGMIEIAFSEEVTGNIALQTEGGDNVGWIAKVDGTKGRLELVKGRELVNETIYVIIGKVSTADGVETDIKITFTTKGKA